MLSITIQTCWHVSLNKSSFKWSRVESKLNVIWGQILQLYLQYPRTTTCFVCRVCSLIITFRHRDMNTQTQEVLRKFAGGLRSINKHTTVSAGGQMADWCLELWAHFLIYTSSVCFKLTNTLKHSCISVKLLQLSPNQNKKRLMWSNRRRSSQTCMQIRAGEITHPRPRTSKKSAEAIWQTTAISSVIWGQIHPEYTHHYSFFYYLSRSNATRCTEGWTFKSLEVMWCYLINDVILFNQHQCLVTYFPYLQCILGFQGLLAKHLLALTFKAFSLQNGWLLNLTRHISFHC